MKAIKKAVIRWKHKSEGSECFVGNRLVARVSKNEDQWSTEFFEKDGNLMAIEISKRLRTARARAELIALTKGR